SAGSAVVIHTRSPFPKSRTTERLSAPPLGTTGNGAAGVGSRGLGPPRGRHLCRRFRRSVCGNSAKEMTEKSLFDEIATLFIVSRNRPWRTRLRRARVGSSPVRFRRTKPRRCPSLQHHDCCCPIVASAHPGWAIKRNEQAHSWSQGRHNA